MRYRVPLKITFDGFVIVESESKHDANNIALYNVGASLGNISDNLCDKVIDLEFEHHGTAEIDICRDTEKLDIDYKEVYDDIQNVKKMIDGLSFETAETILSGFNGDDELFDYNFNSFEGTVLNDNGQAKISDNCTYGIFYPDGTYAEECITESEILERIN